MMTMDQPWAEFFFFWWMRWRAPSIPGDDRSSMFNMNRPQLELPMSSCCFRRSGVSVVRPCYYGYRVDYKVHLICCFPCMLSFICTHCCIWHVIFLTIQLDSSLVKKNYVLCVYNEKACSLCMLVLFQLASRQEADCWCGFHLKLDTGTWAKRQYLM